MMGGGGGGDLGGGRGGRNFMTKNYPDLQDIDFDALDEARYARNLRNAYRAFKASPESGNMSFAQWEGGYDPGSGYDRGYGGSGSGNSIWNILSGLLGEVGV